MGHMCARRTRGAGRGRARAASAASKRSPRPARVPQRSRWTRQLAGSAPSTARSASTATSSTRAASARIFATVAPSTGLAGSTCCVTKTASRRRPPRRRALACARAYSSGRREPRRASRPRPRRAARERPVGRTRTSASASAAASSGGTSEAVLAVHDDVGDAAGARADTGRPRQNASTTIRGSPSERDGSTSAVASSSAAATSGVGSLGVQRTRPGNSATSARRRSVIVPRPTRCSGAAGKPRRSQPPGVGEHVDRLVALEHADEEQARARRAAAPAAARGTSPGP